MHTVYIMCYISYSSYYLVCDMCNRIYKHNTHVYITAAADYHRKLVGQKSERFICRVSLQASKVVGHCKSRQAARRPSAPVVGVSQQQQQQQQQHYHHHQQHQQ